MYCATRILSLAWIANAPALLGISMKPPALAIVVGAPGCGGSYVSVMFDAVPITRITSTFAVRLGRDRGRVDQVVRAERGDPNIDSSMWSHAGMPSGRPRSVPADQLTGLSDVTELPVRSPCSSDLEDIPPRLSTTFCGNPP